MSYRGDFAPGSVIYGKFSTRRDTGLPTTLADALSGSPSGPELHVYKDNSTTQSAVGITLTVDFDGLTGLNHYAIDTSQDAAFYSAGSDFAIVISRGSVNSVAVHGEVIAEFSLHNRSFLRPTVAGRTLDVSAGGEAGLDWANIGSPTTSQNLSGTSTKALEPTTAGRTLDVTATGEAGIDWANIGGATTTVNLSGTTIKDATDVSARIGPAVGSPSAQTISEDLLSLSSRIPAALIGGRMDATVGAYQSGQAPLQPTVAGRTLDVSLGGEAGIDWANVGSQSTTVALSGTTVKTATDVETDTQDIQSRLPAALISGRIDASVGAMASGVLTATAIAADAITAGKIADGAIDAATFAAGAIDAAAIATNAIDADALAADAVTEIQSGLSTLTAAGVRSAVGLASANLDTQLSAIDDYVDTEVAAIKVVTDKLNTTLESVGSPNDYVFTAAALAQAPTGTGSGPTAVQIADEVQTRTIAAVTTVNGLAANTVNASALAADAVAEIQSGLATSSALMTVDSNVASIKSVTDLLNLMIEVGIGSPTYYRFNLGALELAPTGGSAPSAATIADAVWDEARAGHVGAGSFGEGVASVQGNLTGSIGSLAAQAKADVNAEADTALADVGVTTTVTGRIDVAISSRLASASYTAPDNAAIADAVWDEARAGHVGAGSFGEGVIVQTVSDKTGYRLSATGVNDILRTALTEGYAADGSTFTLEQFAYMVWSLFAERSIISTTLTAKKLDGSTAAMTFTLDDATTPTAQTRSG